MPWHSPRCPIHHMMKGRKIGISPTNPNKWIYECKQFIHWDGDTKIYETHTFEDWGHEAIDEMVKRRNIRKKECGY